MPELVDFILHYHINFMMGSKNAPFTFARDDTFLTANILNRGHRGQRIFIILGYVK
jgi:hypothetical protein